jgi:hypothetical protein
MRPREQIIGLVFLATTLGRNTLKIHSFFIHFQTMYLEMHHNPLSVSVADKIL